MHRIPDEDEPLPPPLRVGHGYDIHRLELLDVDRTDADGVGAGGGGGGRRPQRAHPLVIGGIDFEHERGAVGHSDGDALLHAITDAVLGALGLPDIGELFPDTDPRWVGAASEVFVAEAMRLAAERGWRVGNLDATVVLERPKIGPRKEEIRRNLARLLGIPSERANLKAKTHERVDAVGEGRAVEAHAVVLMVPARQVDAPVT